MTTPDNATTPAPLSPLESRRLEVAQYETNIATYTSLAASLPSEYPAHLEQYRTATDRHGVVADVSLSDIDLLADLWFGDDCRKAIRTETVEMRKAKAILTALEAQA